MSAAAGEAAAAVKHKNDNFKQTIVETIEATRLEYINVRNVVAFRESRDIYQRRISEKLADATVQVPLTTYRNSIDESVLELFVMAKWVDSTSVDSITEDQIKSYIDKLARVEWKYYPNRSLRLRFGYYRTGHKNRVHGTTPTWGQSRKTSLESLPEVFDYAEEMWL